MFAPAFPPDDLPVPAFIGHDELLRLANDVADYSKTNRDLILHPNDEPMHNAYMVAATIIGIILGVEWYNKQIISHDNKAFFRNNPNTWHDIHVHFMRTIFLGECLFNMQRVSGFEQVVRQLKNEKTESAVTELEVGMLLMQQGVAFRFVKPRREKGFDYDIELFHPNGEICCVDAKCKFEGGTYSENAIINSLREARRRNLNPNMPGIVFIKMPQDWHESKEFELIFASAVQKKILRHTGKVVLVHGFGVGVFRVDQERIKTTIIDREIINETHEFDPTMNWHLMRRLPPIPLVFCWTQLIMLPPLYKHTKLFPPFVSGRPEEWKPS